MTDFMEDSFTEAQFREIAEHLQEVFWIIDVKDQQIIYVSSAYENLWGQACQELYTKPNCWLDAVHPEDEERVRAAQDKQLTGDYNESFRILRSDGSICWVRDRAYSLKNRQGEDYRIIRVTEDITQHLAAQQMLEHRVEERTQEIERRRQVAEGLRDILTVLNSNKPLQEVLDYIIQQTGRLLYADAAALYRLDKQGDILKIQSAHGLSESYVAIADVPLGQAITGQAAQTRRPVILRDVSAIPPEEGYKIDAQRQALLDHLAGQYRSVLSVPLVAKDEIYGAITLYYKVARFVTEEEVRLAVAFSDQAALALENARLRSQVEQAAVTAERNRLARDLHDSVTQTLFSASLISEVLPAVWKRSQMEGEQALEEMRKLTRAALAEMRSLLIELRPAALIEARLEDLLRQLCEAMTGRARIPIVLEVDGEPLAPPDIRVALYRIAQEALNNVVKHSRASRALVRLHAVDRSDGGSGGEQAAGIELCIEDDGLGFTSGQESPQHIGLTIMRERAEAGKIDLNIWSQPGQGTRIRAFWRGP